MPPDVNEAMTGRPALVTGFEPYAGGRINPSREIVRALDGQRLDGTQIVGRTIPVSYRGLKTALAALIEELQPAVVISFGLWPGESVIRLERIGINVADFEIADNEGLLTADERVHDNGASAHLSTLPLRATADALLAQGIPARISSTAGTFLCNACLYTLLDQAAARASGALCGFVHVPYLPAQVAEIIGATRDERRFELHQRADLASMDLAMMIKAAEIALAEAIRHAARDSGPASTR
jgi:pyroglutamyl-peptidase